MARFSETVIDRFQSPRNLGRLDSPDCVGLAGAPGQSGYLVLHLMVKDDRISAARFQCHNCGATIATGSMLTELILGRTLEECRQLTSAEFTEALDGLPPDKRHCAGLAIHALHQALETPPEREA